MTAQPRNRKLIPQDAIDAVEALLRRMARGKYKRQRWPFICAEEHAMAMERHRMKWLAGTRDEETGESHAVHAAARALFVVAVELRATQNRTQSGYPRKQTLG